MERTLTVDAMAALEEFYFRSIGQAELRVEPARFCVFVADPRIHSYPVMMAAFHHERPRKNEIRHFGVIERLPEIPVWHFPLDGAHEAE